ncbi:hypothetical protein QQF64_008721 [Cirrhinus molitorella]|uniref:Uncharacterized protein n=1 Tax=Cirrhinus molitorella TaxID=172907 RepID=A0ABR3MAB9_9TELE
MYDRITHAEVQWLIGASRFHRRNESPASASASVRARAFECQGNGTGERAAANYALRMISARKTPEKSRYHLHYLVWHNKHRQLEKELSAREQVRCFRFRLSADDAVRSGPCV